MFRRSREKVLVFAHAHAMFRRVLLKDEIECGDDRLGVDVSVIRMSTHVPAPDFDSDGELCDRIWKEENPPFQGGRIEHFRETFDLHSEHKRIGIILLILFQIAHSKFKRLWKLHRRDESLAAVVGDVRHIWRELRALLYDLHDACPPVQTLHLCCRGHSDLILPVRLVRGHPHREEVRAHDGRAAARAPARAERHLWLDLEATERLHEPIELAEPRVLCQGLARCEDCRGAARGSATEASSAATSTTSSLAASTSVAGGGAPSAVRGPTCTAAASAPFRCCSRRGGAPSSPCGGGGTSRAPPKSPTASTATLTHNKQI